MLVTPGRPRVGAAGPDGVRGLLALAELGGHWVWEWPNNGDPEVPCVCLMNWGGGPGCHDFLPVGVKNIFSVFLVSRSLCGRPMLDEASRKPSMEAQWGWFLPVCLSDPQTHRHEPFSQCFLVTGQKSLWGAVSKEYIFLYRYQYAHVSA